MGVSVCIYVVSVAIASVFVQQTNTTTWVAHKIVTTP